MQKWILSVTLLSIVGCSGQMGQTNDAPELPEGITFVEQVTATKGEAVIPYRKYTLDNGLTVVLHEDNSDP